MLCVLFMLSIVETRWRLLWKMCVFTVCASHLASCEKLVEKGGTSFVSFSQQNNIWFWSVITPFNITLNREGKRLSCCHYHQQHQHHLCWTDLQHIVSKIICRNYIGYLWEFRNLPLFSFPLEERRFTFECEFLWEDVAPLWIVAGRCEASYNHPLLPVSDTD